MCVCVCVLGLCVRVRVRSVNVCVCVCVYVYACVYVPVRSACVLALCPPLCVHMVVLPAGAVVLRLTVVCVCVRCLPAGPR